MSGHPWFFIAIMLFCLPVTAQGQVYPSSPDWISSDDPYSTGAALVDLDKDGLLDLVVSNGNDMNKERLAVYYNQGDGNFPAYPDWQAQDNSYNGHLDVADVNGDGWMDVAVVHLLESLPTQPAAKLYLNNNGTLSSLPDWISDESARAFGVAFGDVNNDGRPDLAVATGWAYSPPKYYKNYVYLNVNGQLETTASWASDDANLDQGCLWVDADDDGWLDLVCTGRNRQTRLYRNTGGALTTTAVWQTSDNINQDAIMITAGDVDQDGHCELIVTDNTQLAGGSGLIRLYSGEAGGYFTRNPTWSFYEGYGSAAALVDVNRDERLDLFTGGWWDNTNCFLNTGLGFASQPDWSSAVTSVVEKIVFGDLDPTAHTVKRFKNIFPPDGARRLFHLSRCQIQGATSVVLDGQPLTPSQYVLSREFGWITVPTAPTTALVVEFDYSISLDMAVSNWDSSKGNYIYYNRLEPDWLDASPVQISAATGGTVQFDLKARGENGNRDYFLLGSVTGTDPGFALPGGLTTLPLNWDVFTGLVFKLANTPFFYPFQDTLDAAGEGAAQLNTFGPLPPASVGAVLYFAYALYYPFNFASNPVGVQIVP